MKPLQACHVLVTPTSFGQRDPDLRKRLESSVGRVTYNRSGRPLGSDELRALLDDVDGYIAGLDMIDSTALELAPHLRVIARYGAGVDRVDLEAAKARGIAVTNTPDTNTVSVAELTVGLLLALARNIPAASSATKAGTWPRLHGLCLEGKVVGLVGLGAIGRQVARRLQAFDCTVLACDPAADAERAREVGATLVGDLDALLARSDVVSLHVPALPSTRGMVDRGFLARMNRGALLINTARGELIDEAALLEALQSGHLAGAALDVFASEPPDAAAPLLALPQVIVTPHIGAHTDAAIAGMGRAALEDCLAVLEGKQPRYRIV